MNKNNCIICSKELSPRLKEMGYKVCSKHCDLILNEFIIYQHKKATTSETSVVCPYCGQKHYIQDNELFAPQDRKERFKCEGCKEEFSYFKVTVFSMFEEERKPYFTAYPSLESYMKLWPKNKF